MAAGVQALLIICASVIAFFAIIGFAPNFGNEK